jgi:hypothetical protein
MGRFGHLLRALRSARGKDLILAQNLFAEQRPPQSILRTLTAEDTSTAAFFARRVPVLSWQHSLPIAGEPREIRAHRDRKRAHAQRV